MRFGYLLIGLVLAAHVCASQAEEATEPNAGARKVLSQDDDWRFQKGDSPLPGRTKLGGWRYRIDPRGEALAKEVSTPGLDTSGPEWAAGSYISRGKDTTGEEWREGGNLGPKGSVFHAWFRTEIKGFAARRPTLEFIGVTGGDAAVYVNGARLKQHRGGRAEMFTVDISSVWNPTGINVIALLMEAKDNAYLDSPVELVDLDQTALPATSWASPAFNDSAWRVVSVPHDYVVEGPVGTRGPDGYTREIAWYRKNLVLPTYAPGSRVWLEFDGVYRASRYWLNGQELGVHNSGYVPFRFDITALIKPGDNALAVRVDPRYAEGWWYDGGGIYRHVRLVITAPIHVAPEGIFLTTTIPDAKNGIVAPATLHIDATLRNDSADATEAEIVHEVMGPDHKAVQRSSERIRLGVGEMKQKVSLEIPSAMLWSCEHPVLYSVRTTIQVRGEVVDQVTNTFGFRTVAFDPERGFLLNSEPVKIKGTCNHESHSGVGVAIPDRLHVWRLEQLKAMGGNAVRCSHNAMSPVFYDACDRLGILVMDEFRQFSDGYSVKVNRNATADHLTDQINQVKRNRNHPCIVIWSICNEEAHVTENEDGARLAKAFVKMLQTYDGTRPTTASAVHGWAKEGLCGVIDVVGVNYTATRYDKIRETFPTKPFLGTESCSETSTRGFYERTPFKNTMGAGPTLYGDEKKGYLSNYSENGPGWYQSCEVGWKAVASRPWMAGYFVWTGFDYKGEPTPFAQPAQPSISSSFGIMDTCGFPKDSYYYYKSWWGSEPVLHVFPHWNWEGKEGQEIPVWVHSNCDEVELFLNEKSLGKKKMERNGHLEWQVPYAPGKLEARGISQGKQLSAVRETTGVAAGIALAPDRSDLTADGADLAWVAVSVVDEKGRTVPTAGNLIRFSVTGPGKILGVGNGDSSCHEPDKATQRSAFNGLCMVLVQTTRTGGDIVLTAESDGLKRAMMTLKSK